MIECVMTKSKGNFVNADLERGAFPSFVRRRIEGSFTGGDVSSDGGIMVLRAADRRLGLLQALDAASEVARINAIRS